MKDVTSEIILSQIMVYDNISPVCHQADTLLPLPYFCGSCVVLFAWLVVHSNSTMILKSVVIQTMKWSKRRLWLQQSISLLQYAALTSSVSINVALLIQASSRSFINRITKNTGCVIIKLYVCKNVRLYRTLVICVYRCTISQSNRSNAIMSALSSVSTYRGHT